MDKKKFTEEELKDWVLQKSFEDYMKLLKWLYDNHKGTLREWEKSQGHKLQLEFL